MLTLEWWSFEVMMIMSAYISVSASAVQVTLMNTASFFFMFSIGINIAGSVLVGKSVGKNDPVEAKQY